MAYSRTDTHFTSTLFGDSEVAGVFSESQFIRFMLDFESALAKVQGRLKVIPAEAAAEIASKATTIEVDVRRLRSGVEKSGVPVIELVNQLREQVAGDAASYVHWGATSQDVVDTALVLQIQSALAIMEPRLKQVCARLARLADQHRTTLMAGRTHSQQALPVPFGLKVAGWLAPLLRHRERLEEIKPRLLTLQLGGAAGTLSAMGVSGTAVMAAMAVELDLSTPRMPWHTQRDSLVEFAGWLSLVSSSLAKMAQDIILMAQSEVGELRETADITRGGSSTMPQKSNPIISELIIAAARTNASLLSNMHQAMVQEHERATHGWQMEWLALPQMVELTAACLDKALFISQNLLVNEERMRENVAGSNGLMLAEAITFALAPAYMSRTAAKKLVREACQVVLQEGKHLIDVVQAETDAPLDWLTLRDESAYFGAADTFINHVLEHV